MKFIKYIILFIFCFFFILEASFFMYSRGYDKYFWYEKDKLNEVIRGNTYHDILFIGSSRTYYHINPRIIDSVTRMNSFNAGINGANLLEMNLMLQCYYRNHKAPKLLVVDLANSAFDIAFSPFFNAAIYYGYLDNDIVYKTLSPYKRVGLYKNFPFTRFTEEDDFEREGAFLGTFGQRKSIGNSYHKGHLTIGTDTISLPFKRRNYPIRYDISEEGKRLLKQIIDTARAYNSRIVFTYAPVYNLQDYKKMNELFFPTIRETAAANNIPFLNYRQCNFTKNHRLFRDETHLNNVGSDLYSAMLSNDLLKYL